MSLSFVFPFHRHFVGIFQTNSFVEPLNSLAEDKLIHVDQDDQRFGCSMAVWLESEDPMLRRKDNTKEVLVIGDVVCGPYAADDSSSYSPEELAEALAFGCIHAWRSLQVSLASGS
jgi:hypothetical protein